MLEDGLKENYDEATVKVKDCPDLTKEPFRLAAKGFWRILIFKKDHR